jgi:hypothetical protein
LSRLVNVARWGYTAGLMPKADAWSWIMLAARKLQTSFRSWQSLGQDFILGCEFWALSTGATEEIDLAPSYNWLVSSPESPWVQLPWETPLGA